MKQVHFCDQCDKENDNNDNARYILQFCVSVCIHTGVVNERQIFELFEFGIVSFDICFHLAPSNSKLAPGFVGCF